MWKLTLLLCGAMFLVLLLGGEERGQLRPGLALAEAERTAGTAPEAPVFEPAPILVTAEERAPAPAPAALPAPAPIPQTVTEPDLVNAEIAEPEPLPEVATPALPEPTVPFSVGLGVAEPEPALPVQPAPPTQEAVEAAAPASGQILYVSANSVNVRQDPSTNAPVLGRLTRGEPAAVMWEEGTDWLRIEAINSGLEGYVARRFLTPDQP